MGVEGRASDRASLCGCEEGGVGLDGVDACAVDVEEGEGVGVGATVLILARVPDGGGEKARVRLTWQKRVHARGRLVSSLCHSWL